MATEKKQVFSLKGFDVSHYKQTEAYTQAIDQLYNNAIQEFAFLASKTKINPDKLFSFSDYPSTKAAASKIIGDLANKMQGVISNGSKEQWLYACKKNDQFLSHILNTSKVPKATLKKWQDQNLDALSSFQKRKVSGMDLSKRIWNYAGQMKTQMELGIDIAIGEGNSAQVLSKELRQYLVDPDKLFRRVRDKHGNLQLSKAAKAFHPGQGKYRSSYKNAMRLTRSEINMAYSQSDQLRWEQLDFVVGYEIRLSNNHTLNGKPFVDICDELAGKYPKTFNWKAKWHPQCRCERIPILKSDDELKKDRLNRLREAFNGTKYKKFQSKNEVTDVPEAFKNWISDNMERSQNWKSQPYWIKDNFEGGNLAGGLKVSEMAKKQAMKPVKSTEQKTEIQKKWNTRVATNKFSNKIQEVESMFGDLNSISQMIGKIKTIIKAGSDVDKVSSLVNMLENKVNVKKAWDERKEEKQLGDLLPNLKELKKTYSIKELQSVHDAVDTKLKSFESLTLEKQEEKLKFEIDWVEKNKKYNTWPVAKDSYKKKLEGVQYKVQKQAIKDSITKATEYASSTKSPKVKEMAAEVQKLIDKDAPISTIQAKANELNDKVNKLIADNAAKRSKKKLGPINEDSFSKERKDLAMWEKTVKAADKNLRDNCGQVWRSATQEEREAAYFYTHTFSSINEPLRGVPYYGGKSLSEAQSKVPHLTSIIEKSSYDFDMWVQRGVDALGFNGVFGIDINPYNLANLIGKTGIDKGFGSCGVAKGKGFSHKRVIYNIYCPRGTKMMYLEPFSQYGKGTKSPNWNGIDKQSSFGEEAEILLQRGTQFRIIKAEYKDSDGKYYVDVEVIWQ